MTGDKSKAAEQSVIGCILIDAARIMPEAAGRLKAGDFELAPCKQIFEVCGRRFLSGKPIDALTVLHELGGEDAHKVYLARLMEAAPSTVNYAEYIAIVSENAHRRRAVTACDELRTAANRQQTLVSIEQ